MSETNIRQLAKELGLSISTVSKALKDSYEISADTKKRVLETARLLNYSPNPYASSLRRKKSNTIAVVIPEVADSFFSQAIKGIEEVAQNKGYHVLIYLTYEQVEKENRILDEFLNGRVDGVLISVTTETADAGHIEKLQQNNVPVVYFDRACNEPDTASVVTNDLESGYQATQHLLAQGCTSIYFLSISNLLSINNERLQGYRQALEHAGLNFEPDFVVECTNDDAINYQLLSRVMQQAQPPDGILSSVEKLITPVYSICKSIGLNIPGDIRIMSFSNSPLVHILHPPLTTITQPAFEMGRTAAEVLFKALQKPGFSLQKDRTIIKSILHVRGSTAVGQ